MRNLFLLLAITISIASITVSQNYIYVGDKQYKATESWKFKINGTSWGNDLEITIGRDGTKGLLMLQTEVTKDSYIGGNVYIFLSDGSRITCTDKKIRDNVDNKSIAIYKLTSDEVNRMKVNHITQIRFTIQPSSDGGFNGTKTADNKKIVLYGSNSKNYHETDVAVKKLFE